MANNVIKVKRTAVSGRAANTNTIPNPGELGLNMADGILYSTNGTFVFEIGANNTNVNVTGNATINAIVANGSVGSSGQTLFSNGSSIYWATPASGNGGGSSVSINEVLVDFGPIPVYSKSFTVTVPATLGQKVIMTSSSQNADEDHLEMDNFVAGGLVTAANTVKVSITAVPGPVANTRYFNLIVG